MTIEKMPCSKSVWLTDKIKTGYRAKEGEYYGWGKTRAAAIADVIDTLERIKNNPF